MESVKKLAHDLGFALCRVAPAVEPPRAEAFRQWIANGCASGMEWMMRNADKRVDLQKILPGVQSVIVLALPYFQGSGPAGIARYAWNEDYHDIVAPKLRCIDDFLQKHGGVQKCCMDTAPILERDYAELAGAGWRGKNTMLVHPQMGQWFLLAEVLTTLPLPPDTPMPNRCGRCTRCLDACPTGALTEYRLDARRCLAYWTIENKGSIPEPIRPLLGGRIYGCDTCAAACPWNRFAQASRNPAFAPRPAVQLGLRELLALDDVEFRTLFCGSPILRIKRRGLLRNVCVALGNTGVPADFPALQRAAVDPDPLIAEHAEWAIARIQKLFKPVALDAVESF